MTYKVLKSLVYGGIAYAEGQKVDIIEKSVAENCLERELIAEITDTEVVETEETKNNEDAAEEAVSSEENTETEETENNEDATEEVVPSEENTETTENVEEPIKTNKRNKK